MSNSVNNKLLNTQSNNRPKQIFDINLDADLISSLQESINNLNSSLTLENSVQDQSQKLPESENQVPTPIIEDIQKPKLVENIAFTKRASTTSYRTNNKVDSIGQSKRLYSPGSNISVTNKNETESKVPKIQVPFLDRLPIGSQLQIVDGTLINSKKNNDGTSSEIITYPNGATVKKTFQDFPVDKNGNSTGFRTTIVDNNYKVTILSTIINDLGGGNFSTVTTDLTDNSSPQNVMSSALRKTNNVLDDDGNLLYNSVNSRADGYSETVTHEKLVFDDVNSLRRPSGYKTTYNTTDAKGQSSTTITETISYTDENGKRLTVIYDISDPNNMVEISKLTRNDPFKEKKLTGSLITKQLDQIKNWGLLDITGDGNLDPLSDLLLISRYLKGKRGNDLISNINLGQNSQNLANLEQKISTVLNRGLLDIVGSQSETNKEDLKILARYMMGARGEVLLDKKLANDDSIAINQQGTNVLTIDEENPILTEIQGIFGVSGKKMEFSNATGQKQNYRLFFVNTTNT